MLKLKKVFYLPNHSDVSRLHGISGLTSVGLQIEITKLFFFACIVSNDGMFPVVSDIFRFRAKEYFSNPECVPTGFMGDIVRLLKKYDLHAYFSLWIKADLFRSYASWKRIVNELTLENRLSQKNFHSSFKALHFKGSGSIPQCHFYPRDRQPGLFLSEPGNTSLQPLTSHKSDLISKFGNEIRKGRVNGPERMRRERPKD